MILAVAKLGQTSAILREWVFAVRPSTRALFLTVLVALDNTRGVVGYNLDHHRRFLLH